MDLGMLVVGLAAYGAVFAFVGARIKRPLVVGLVFAFGWEPAVLLFPGYLKRLDRGLLSAGAGHRTRCRRILRSASSCRSSARCRQWRPVCLCLAVIMGVTLWLRAGPSRAGNTCSSSKMGTNGNRRQQSSV